MAANKLGLSFRRLKSNEIEARIARTNNGGVSLLLYIDARAVMRLLDETVGAYNWTDEYREMHGSVFCKINIRDPESGEWIGKEDVGSESNVEKEKGQVSDAFKRAAVKWGIGRELYTAPDIFVPAQNCNMAQGNKCYDKFNVDRIVYNDDGEIIYVRIINQTMTNRTGKLCIAYEYKTAAFEAWKAANAKKANTQEQPRQQAPAQTQATQQQPQQRPQQQGQPTQQQGQARQGQATQQQPRQQQGHPTQGQGQPAQGRNGQATQPQQRPQPQQQRPQPQPQPRGNVDSGPLPFDVLPFPTLEDLGFSPTYEDDDEDELPFCN